MYFIGIDLGTSSVKMIAMDEEGRIHGEISKDYPVSYLNGNWAEQNPEDWWLQTMAGLKELIKDYIDVPEKIKAISFSGQMHGLTVLDSDKNVLMPAILWCDQRTQEECDIITDHFGKEAMTEMVGNKALTGFTAPKILWVKRNHPEIFERIEHILLPKDYVRYKLTGELATDLSDASGMLLLDVKKRTWSEEMLNFLGIASSQLPGLFESYEPTGKLTESVKAELGLSQDVIVVAGAGDQAAGAIGTGTVEEGIVSVTLGTSGVVFGAHDQYVVDADNRLHAFCHGNGKYHSMGVMLSAASCLQWWIENVQKSDDFEVLLEEAMDAESDVIFLPYLIGERTPYADPDARGCFVGMDMNTGRGHMTRAVLEGVAFGLKDSFDIMEDMQVPIKEIRLIGGGSKSGLWKQILADVFGKAICSINTSQGGALGAAILAAVGFGTFSSVEEAAAKIIKVVDEVQPDLDKFNRYAKKHERYTGLYHDLREFFRN